MGILTILYIVLYEVERCKFMMPVCGSDCQKGVTSSPSLTCCNWFGDPPC